MSQSSPTIRTASGKVTAHTTAWEPYGKRGEDPPGFSKETLKAALITGARSGGRLLGGEQPVSQMEWLIPHPFRAGALTHQRAQVAKQISPVRIGKPERGPAAVLREGAVPRGDCCEEN